ncbi:hypothetical protein L596_009940 [Steinernema carpocapsae]|uniref:Uncharacterized protein n=1 Tax=Steinernema carpocapsae TaxID=34508 RepID=A0A4U5PGV0_STECR|nr:hypothetical protein L596_009940 [Steinernema carpocapsae]
MWTLLVKAQRSIPTAVAVLTSSLKFQVRAIRPVRGVLLKWTIFIQDCLSQSLTSTCSWSGGEPSLEVNETKSMSFGSAKQEGINCTSLEVTLPCGPVGKTKQERKANPQVWFTGFGTDKEEHVMHVETTRFYKKYRVVDPDAMPKVGPKGFELISESDLKDSEAKKGLEATKTEAEKTKAKNEFPQADQVYATTQTEGETPKDWHNKQEPTLK